jgi:uroporphyrinogen-III decarboxylase
MSDIHSFAVPSDAEKAAVWKAYYDRRPKRVPLRWNINSRVVVLDPVLNPEGFTYKAVFNDAQTLITVALRTKSHIATVLSRVSDASSALPETIDIGIDNQNTYDAAYFGAEVTFRDGQVPATEPVYTLDDLDRFLAMDFSRPLENSWLAARLRFHAEVTRLAAGLRWEGRPVRIVPLLFGFDGPLTVAMNLFGGDILMLMADEPERAQRLFEFLAREAMRRNQALRLLAGLELRTPDGGLADDSIQLISTETLESVLLPVYARYMDDSSMSTLSSRNRGMHLCGDATRHFPLLVQRLGVVSFDTGYPVDHGALRRALGDDIEISGGPEISLLLHGTPDACHQRAKAILQSGIMRGGRFILQEANNLPPRVPLANLAAVYAACLKFGQYPQ